MKSDIFITAIRNRNYLTFLYRLKEIHLEPYYIAREKSGKKVIYGRVNTTKEIKKFEYDRIANIKVVDTFKFSPIIPIISQAV